MEYTIEESIVYSMKEGKIHTKKEVKRSHEFLNHKRKKNLEYVYRNSEKFDTETRKNIK